MSLNRQPVAGLTQTMQAALHFGFDPMQGSSCILAGLTLAHTGLNDPCGAPTQYILLFLVFFLCLFLWLTTASLDLMKSSLSLHYEACYHTVLSTESQC